MKRTGALLTLLCGVAAIFLYDRLKQPATANILGASKEANGATKLSLLSDSYRIDRLFQSMQGPYGTHTGIALGQGSTPELLWLTGLGTEVVSKNGKANLSQEFFCHANLSFDAAGNSPDAHNQMFGTSTDWRLFTLVPGRMSINLPEGFGIPVSSKEKLELVSMSLNLNEPDPDFNLRFKSHIKFVAEREAPGQMKPLFMRGLYVLVPILRGTSGNLPEEICAVPGSTNLNAELMSQGMACAPPSMTASDGGVRGTNTLHWMVPPGRHTYIYDVTEQMKLNFDTTMHYATGHLHPLGERLALVDKTTGETVLEIRSKDYAGKIGVERMEEFSFPEGKPIYKDHQYELVTTYNNLTGKPADVMAIFYAYLLDHGFDRASIALTPASPGKQLAGGRGM
jgi:hypothetical protein